jgi:hypothetical protein
MSATDQTLLARLGFQDPDRKDLLHDWACQYLAQPEVLEKLVAPLAVTMEHVCLERHITKGYGQYKQTIGFVDLFASLARYTLILEVKISPVSIGDALRQLNLYREYADGGNTIVFLVTAYKLDETDVATLAREGIRHAVLGPGFHEFVKLRAAKADTKNTEI